MSIGSNVSPCAFFGKAAALALSSDQGQGGIPEPCTSLLFCRRYRVHTWYFVMFTKHSTVSVIIALDACARKLVSCIAIKINLKSSADKIVVSWF